MGRTYSDPSYGSKKFIELAATGALNGTVASTTAIAATVYTVMQPITVTDFNAFFVAGGTSTTQRIVLGYSLAGTGAITAIGTLASYTQAISTVADAAVTETNLSAGDDLVVGAFGTSTTVENVKIVVQYRERYVQSDS
jgi:hypothetical protein